MTKAKENDVLQPNASKRDMHSRTGWRHMMRLNIDIDDTLIADAMKASGAKTKREAVETGLKLLLRLRAQEDIRRFRGKLAWSGDLDAMRRDT